MADEPAGEVQTLDAEHPHVKALTNAGISHGRLTQLVNSATTPIAHEAISKTQGMTPEQLAQVQTQANQAENTQLDDLLMVPQLNTSGVTDANQLGQQFQQAMQQLVTPPIPANPQITNPQIQVQPEATGGFSSNG
jgi:hypothetical protein